MPKIHFQPAKEIGFKPDVTFKPDITFTPDEEMPEPIFPTTPAEPSSPATTPMPGPGVVKRGAYGALGVLSWPFVRAEHAVASVAEPTAKAVLPAMRRALARGKAGQEATMRTLGQGGEARKKEQEQLLKKEPWSMRKKPGELEPLKKIPAALLSNFKKLPPEKRKTLNDLGDTYYKEMTGQDAPGWYKQLFGISASFLIVPGLMGKALKDIGKAAKLTGVPQKIAKAHLPEWQRMKLRARMKTGARIEKAKEVGKGLTGKQTKQLSKELGVGPGAVKQRITQVIKGGVTTKPGIQAAANPAIEEFNAVGKELTRLGILGKETYVTKLPKKRITELLGQKKQIQSQISKLEKHSRFPGRAKQITDLRSKMDNITAKVQASYKTGGEGYFPRMYLSKEEERLARRFPAYAEHRVRAPYAKARKDIPSEVRRAMGEIKEPAFPVTKRLIQSGADIETAKLFEQANRRFGSKVWKKGLHSKALPDSKGYHALSGQFVPKKVYSDVTDLVRVRGSFEKMYDSIIGTWKLGKVVYNPPTHFRNMMSNTILLDLSGMDHAAQVKYLTKALGHIKSGSKEWKVARRYFGRTTLIQGELIDDMLRSVRTAKGQSFEKVINTWNKTAQGIGKYPGAAYQKEEIIGKFMKYLQQRDKGASVIKSVEEANKWLFDYGDLAAWERNVARRVMPFYTFPRKAVPRVAEAMATNPYAIAKYPLLAWTLEKHSLSKLEMTEKDYAQLKKVLPDYMQSGSYLLMPYRDDNGDLRFFDWTYIIPWGMLAEAAERGPADVVITNPMVQIVADLQRNKSSWTDREIWKDTDTQQEKTFKALEYFWKTAVPSLAPKGLYWDKMYNAATGKPSKTGKKPLIPETVAHTVFGLRTQPIDVKEQKKWRLIDKKGDIKQMRSKLYDISIRRKTGNITEEEYQAKKKQYAEQIRKILKK